MKKLGLISMSLVMIYFISGCCDDKNNNTMEKTPAVMVENMDKNTSPGENFFEYVNGSWMAENDIPPEYSQFGAFTELFENNQKQLQALIETVSVKTDIATGSAGQKIRDLYNSGMDTIVIEKAGITPISSDLQEIANLSSITEIQHYIASMQYSADYLLHLISMFELAGDNNSQANTKAKAVMNIETGLAQVSKSRLERRDPIANFNKM